MRRLTNSTHMPLLHEIARAGITIRQLGDRIVFFDNLFGGQLFQLRRVRDFRITKKGRVRIRTYYLVGEKRFSSLRQALTFIKKAIYGF